MADSLTYGFSGRGRRLTRRHVPSSWTLGANRSRDAVYHRGPGNGLSARISYSDVLEVKVIKSLLTSGVALTVRARPWSAAAIL